MKKTFVTGLLAVGLIAAGGTGFYMTSVSAKADGATMMHSQGMMKLMGGMMNTGSADEKQGSMCDKKMNTGKMQKMMDGKKISAGEMQKMMGDKKMSAGEMQKMMGDKKISADEMQKMMGDKKMNADEMKKMMDGMKMSAEEMQKIMKSGKMDFETMKPYMKKMHPDLSDKQLEELFKSMQEKGCPGNMKDQSEKMNSL